MASKMISGATPFSFDIASTIMRISLLIGFSNLERNGRDALQASGTRRATPTRLKGSTWSVPSTLMKMLPSRQPSRTPRKFLRPSMGRLRRIFTRGAAVACEMGRLEERSIRSRRRHLEVVGAGNGIFDVENAAHLVADPLAVTHADSGFGIDVDAQQGALRSHMVLDSEQLVAERLNGRPDQLLHFALTLVHWPWLMQKKWARGPLSLMAPSRIPVDPAAEPPQKTPYRGSKLLTRSGGRDPTCTHPANAESNESGPLSSTPGVQERVPAAGRQPPVHTVPSRGRRASRAPLSGALPHRSGWRGAASRTGPSSHRAAARPAADSASSRSESARMTMPRSISPTIRSSQSTTGSAASVSRDSGP